jgi:hypothetical protein
MREKSGQGSDVTNINLALIVMADGGASPTCIRGGAKIKSNWFDVIPKLLLSYISS